MAEYPTRSAIVVIAFLSILAACGGGGGGGATPPVPGGGGGPTPGKTATPAPSGSPTATPHPTGSPTATPRPTNSPTTAPTATPTPATPTPAPTATPSGSGITILPDTRGRFGLIQILDNYGGVSPLTSSQIQSEAPHYDSVWGSFDPSDWNAAHPGMIVSRYMIPNEDDNLISGHNLSWWQSNHPDWVLYACDQNGNPTSDLPWAYTGFSDVPLDIHNPDVVNYQVHLLGDYMIANGYNTLAVDNITFINYLAAPNPVLGEGEQQPGWYACGIYSQGPSVPSSFVRRYGSAGSSDFDQPDPAWISDLINWLAQARNIFATDSTLAPYHLHILVNHPVLDSGPDSNEQQMLSYVDGMVDENGYTHYGQLLSGGNFAGTLNWAEYLQSNHKAALITDYFCTGSSCSNDVATLSAQQVDWALASYAIGDEGGEDLYTSPHGGSIYSYRPEYATSYGMPCGSYTQPSSYVYERTFQGGLAIVNASGSSYNLALSSSHTYHDIEGRTLTNPLTVAPEDGYFLLTSNGCSP
jgi:hypothetical protein